MNNQPPYQTLDNLTETIKTFLAAPPVGTPTYLITALTELAGFILPNHNTLPPRLFYEATEQVPIAISIIDLNAIILYANLAFERITGYTPAEIVGQNQSILFDNTTPTLVYETLWDCLQQQQTWSRILLNRRKEGERYLAEVSIIPVLNGHGETLYYLAMYQDVTAVHRLEQQVKNQMALIESVVDAALVVIVLLDEQGQVILSNQKYRKLAEELLTHEPATVFLNAIKDVLGPKWSDLRAKHGSFSDQEVRIDPIGYHHPRWFVCSGTWFDEHDESADTFFETHQQRYLLLVANEVTILKRQQEEIRLNALRALLAEEELTEGMRETLAGALHQLEGPMNLISAALSMLKRRTSPNSIEDPLCVTLQETLAASNQVIENLRQCLFLPDHGEESASPVNLNELINDVLTISTQRLLAEGIVVDWQPAMVLPSMLGHAAHLRSMLKQLIDNAIDAMRKTVQERELRILTTGDNHLITVTIADTGVGIPEELRFKVFEPFFTTKTMEKRVGMGLATVQEIINRHAGTIHIDSNGTQGCCFILQFRV